MTVYDIRAIFNGVYSITIEKSCLKYCFKADNFYDFERRLRLLFLMKGWKI